MTPICDECDNHPTMICVAGVDLCRYCYMNHLSERPMRPFQDNDVVEFRGMPGTFWEVTLADGDYLDIEHLCGPELTDHEHLLLFGVKRPDSSVVLASVMRLANEMEVLASASSVGVVEQLAERWGITVVDAALSDEPSHKDYKNRSTSAGGDWILLGIYNDTELRLLSFFHELGHCVNARRVLERGENRVVNPEHDYHHYSEALAWRTGLELAQAEDVEFSGASLRWARKQLGTYFRDDHPEKTPLRFLDQAARYAFEG